MLITLSCRVVLCYNLQMPVRDVVLQAWDGVPPQDAGVSWTCFIISYAACQQFRTRGREFLWNDPSLLCSLFLFLKPFRENDNIIVFVFPFNIFMSLPNVPFIRLRGRFPILRTISWPNLYPLIWSSRRSLALVWGICPGICSEYSYISRLLRCLLSPTWRCR